MFQMVTIKHQNVNLFENVTFNFSLNIMKEIQNKISNIKQPSQATRFKRFLPITRLCWRKYACHLTAHI